MVVRAYTEAMRAVGYVTAAAVDNARHAADAAERAKHQAFVDLMIPIVKGWCTETAQEVTYLGVQVHGGMGFIEETGAAQYYRDARIITIYEGTTGIQANDLIGRKTARDGGATARLVAAQIDKVAAQLASQADPSLNAIGLRLAAAREAFVQVVDFVAGNTKASPNAVFAGSVPYLMLAGNLVAGWQLARALMVAEDQLRDGIGDAAFLRAKIATAHFYAWHLLSKAPGVRDAIVEGGESVTAMALEAF